MSNLVKVLRGHYMSVCPGKITREQRYYLDAIRTSLDAAADHIEAQDKRIAELEKEVEKLRYSITGVVDIAWLKESECACFEAGYDSCCCLGKT